MDNRKQKILAVGQILPGVLKDITRGNIHEQAQIEDVWASIAGAQPAGACLNGIRDGAVFITVDSPARLFYWKIRSGVILKRFQERRPDVKNIAFKIGKVI